MSSDLHCTRNKYQFQIETPEASGCDTVSQPLKLEQIQRRAVLLRALLLHRDSYIHSMRRADQAFNNMGVC